MTQILLVDDNKDITYTVKTVLEEKDSKLKVESVHSGEECLKYLAEKQSPDIILMDIMMPGIDGMETSIRIKEDPKTKDIPIIFLTAKTDKLTKGMGEICGESYIEKPFDLEDLYAKIMSAIQ